MEDTLVIAKDQKKEKMENDFWRLQGFFWGGGMKSSSEIRQWRWLHNFVDLLKTTEL